MKIRILAAVLAVLLAVIGAVALTNYVAGADQRALAGAESRQVYVVREAIAKGTTATELPPLVARQTVPASAVATGAVTDLAQLTGKVPSAALVPGEQLLTSRFVDPASLKEEKPGVVVPKGMQEVTIQLDAQRVVGGQLTPGDTVGVVFSYNMKKDHTKDDSETPAVTHLELHKVLVTSVQGLPTATAAASPEPSAGPTAEASGGAPSAAAVPEGAVLVTLARKAPDVEKIVWAAENGAIWLTREPSTADESGTRELTVDGVFK